MIVRISLGSDPLRSAMVQAAAGLELFLFVFQGYEDTDFAYDDDRREACDLFPSMPVLWQSVMRG